MKNLSIVIIITILSGCAGGTIGGLLPAPKILKGHLDNLSYTSPDGVFSVTAPVTEERGEWRYTEVKENHEISEDQNSWFVGFKTPYDSHYYTVEVVTFSKELNQANSLLIGSDNIRRVTQTTKQRWKSKVNILTENAVECDTSSFTYTVLQQHITSYDPNFDKYFLISQSFQNNNFIIITSELNFDLRGKSAPIEEIKDVNIEKHNNFVCSVQVHSANVTLTSALTGFQKLALFLK